MKSLILAAVLGLHAAAASASDLGSAGPFRSVAGVVCLVDAKPSCDPPAVDEALPREKQVKAHIARALAFIDSFRMTDARSELDEALRLEHDDVEALHLRGGLAMSEGDVTPAEHDIEHALRIAPQDPDLLVSRAALEMEPSTSAQALRDINAALDAKPDSVDALFIRARLYLQENKTEAALADLDANLAISPQDARARHMRALLHLRKREFDLAAFDATVILKGNPLDAQALATKAEAQSGLGDDPGAIETYTMLLDKAGGIHQLTAPMFHAALVARGRLYAKLGRFDNAKKDLEILVSLKGRQALLWLQLYLRGNGYPNVEISGERTTALNTALDACFSDKICGPSLFR